MKDLCLDKCTALVVLLSSAERKMEPQWGLADFPLKPQEVAAEASFLHFYLTASTHWSWECSQGTEGWREYQAGWSQGHPGEAQTQSTEELCEPRAVYSDGGCAAKEKPMHSRRSGQVKKLFVWQRDVRGLRCWVTRSDLSWSNLMGKPTTWPTGPTPEGSFPPTGEFHAICRFWHILWRATMHASVLGGWGEGMWG